jgi:hypothetical protein
MDNIIPDCSSGFQGQSLNRRSPIHLEEVLVPCGYRAIAFRAASCAPTKFLRLAITKLLQTFTQSALG